MSCSAVAIARSAAFSPAGTVRLALAQHVAHVLRVRVQPQRRDAEVAVQHVAALDDRVLPESASVLAPAAAPPRDGWNQVPSPRSFTRWRIHHTTSLGARHARPVITWLEKAVSMMSHATCVMLLEEALLVRAPATR